MLQLNDGPHGDRQRMMSGLQRLDKTVGCVHLLLDIEQRLLRLPGHVLMVLLILVQRVNERLRDPQLRHLSVIQGESDGAVVMSVDDEVRRNLLKAPAHRLTQ